MKKMHIVLIVLIAAISAILVSTYTKSVDSVTFAQAAEKVDRQVKVVGTFDKTQSIEYDANMDADLTRFYVIDSDGETAYVHLRDKQGKPMGLEMSENVTLEGKMGADGVFYASHMLMKCPSKYNDQKHSLSADN
jgi:cytochrome c-type biogenesis protein CcmE